jgi:hypothetical protein
MRPACIDITIARDTGLMNRLTRSNSCGKKHEGGRMKAIITLSQRYYGAFRPAMLYGLLHRITHHFTLNDLMQAYETFANDRNVRAPESDTNKEACYVVLF